MYSWKNFAATTALLFCPAQQQWRLAALTQVASASLAMNSPQLKQSRRAPRLVQVWTCLQTLQQTTRRLTLRACPAIQQSTHLRLSPTRQLLR